MIVLIVSFLFFVFCICFCFCFHIQPKPMLFGFEDDDCSSVAVDEALSNSGGKSKYAFCLKFGGVFRPKCFD